MRVIGAGWGRTGTTSAAAALDRLGAGPCLQMQEIWARPALADIWNRHREGERADWRVVLTEWGSSVDWPGCWQWQEFADLWPGAPVLLSVRDPDEWYDSVRATIHAWTAPGKDLGPEPIARMLSRVWDDDFGGWERVLDREHATACFRAHNEHVKNACPPERLIEWRVQDGWQPICDALGVTVPDEPFPHLHQR